MITLLVIVLLLVLLSGGYGYSAGWGPYQWGPLGLILLIILVFLLLRVI